MIATSAGLPLSKRGPALDFPDRLYSMARELALLPGNKISTVVNMLSSPVMAELQTNIEAMRGAPYRAVRLTTAIALPADD